MYFVKELKTVSVRINEDYKTNKISDYKNAVVMIKHILKSYDADQEHFGILALNARKNMIGYKIIHTGGLDYSMVDPRLVFRAALLLGASEIILFHNHPSGDSKPSEADKEITRKLTKIGKILELNVLDHIIITHKDCTSLCELGFFIE